MVDLQWDTLSDFYALVAYKNGDISLWDLEAKHMLHSFDRQGAGAYHTYVLVQFMFKLGIYLMFKLVIKL